MKATAFDRFGGPAALHESNVDTPEPGPGQVRPQVRAAWTAPAGTGSCCGRRQRPHRTQMPALAALAASGELKIAIAAIDPLAEAAAAQATVDTGHARGTVVTLI